jgi:hypothetical protein
LITQPLHALLSNFPTTLTFEYDAVGLLHCSTKSEKMEKTGEKVYVKLAKAGKATKKGLKSAGQCAKRKYAAMKQRRQPATTGVGA